MKTLEELKLLEKSSTVTLAYTDYIADVEDIKDNTRKRILRSRIDGRYFYHEMKNGEVVQCFEMALSWAPFPDVSIFAWTPDGIHVCVMDSRFPGRVEYKPLSWFSITSGMKCALNGVTVEFLDNSAIAVNGKRIPVIADSGYTYKLMKRQIKAEGGARGLFSYLENNAKENFNSLVFRLLEDKYG